MTRSSGPRDGGVDQASKCHILELTFDVTVRPRGARDGRSHGAECVAHGVGGGPRTEWATDRWVSARGTDYGFHKSIPAHVPRNTCVPSSVTGSTTSPSSHGCSRERSGNGLGSLFLTAKLWAAGPQYRREGPRDFLALSLALPRRVAGSR